MLTITLQLSIADTAKLFHLAMVVIYVLSEVSVRM